MLEQHQYTIIRMVFILMMNPLLRMKTLAVTGAIVALVFQLGMRGLLHIKTCRNRNTTKE